jgi:hypothetical protein
LKVVIGGGTSGSQSGGVSNNKIYLVEKTNFLLIASKILQLSLKMPQELVVATVVGIF